MRQLPEFGKKVELIIDGVVRVCTCCSAPDGDISFKYRLDTFDHASGFYSANGKEIIKTVSLDEALHMVSCSR